MFFFLPGAGKYTPSGNRVTLTTQILQDDLQFWRHPIGIMDRISFLAILTGLLQGNALTIPLDSQKRMGKGMLLSYTTMRFPTSPSAHSGHQVADLTVSMRLCSPHKQCRCHPEPLCPSHQAWPGNTDGRQYSSGHLAVHGLPPPLRSMVWPQGCNLLWIRQHSLCTSGQCNAA